jgi:hypothetical protein
MKIFKSILLLAISFTGLLAFNTSAAVSCGACVSDGGLGYVRTCCENRIDSEGNPYEYCRTDSCLPGMDPPDTLREGDAPGFTRPPHYAIPDLNIPNVDRLENPILVSPSTNSATTLNSKIAPKTEPKKGEQCF